MPLEADSLAASVCMQLLFYQGAGHPLAQLPNLDWYLGMSLVYFHRARHCFRPDAAYAASLARRVEAQRAHDDFQRRVRTEFRKLHTKKDGLFSPDIFAHMVKATTGSDADAAFNFL